MGMDFPAIIDTAVGVCTLMLVALGDKPARRTRTVAVPLSAQVKASAPIAPEPVSALPRPQSVCAESAPVDSALRSHPHQISMRMRGRTTPHSHRPWSCGATTKPAAMVGSILTAHAEGTALNRIASDTGIHHKTVSKIIDAAENQRRHLVAV